MRNVLRLKKGDTLTIFNDQGEEATGRIDNIQLTKVTVAIESVRKEGADIPVIILACAIPKKSKFELIIEKATELGVDEIIPLKTKRTEMELKGDRLQRKIMTARNASTRQLSEAGILFEQLGDAGLFLWGSVPEGVDVDLLVQDAYRNKILLMRGSVFSANETPDRHIRFNAAFSQHPRLSNYLRERLDAVAQVRASLGRVGVSKP